MTAMHRRGDARATGERPRWSTPRRVTALAVAGVCVAAPAIAWLLDVLPGEASAGTAAAPAAVVADVSTRDPGAPGGQVDLPPPPAPVAMTGPWDLEIALHTSADDVDEVRMGPSDGRRPWSTLAPVAGRPRAWSGTVEFDGPAVLRVGRRAWGGTVGVVGPVLRRDRRDYDVTLHTADVAVDLHGTPGGATFLADVFRVTAGEIRARPMRWSEAVARAPTVTVPSLESGHYLVTASLPRDRRRRGSPTFDLELVKSEPGEPLETRIVRRHVVGMSLVRVRARDAVVHAGLEAWPARVTGRVLDPRGRPLRAALVLLERWGAAGTEGLIVRVEVDAEGAFTMVGPRGLRADLVAIAGGPDGEELRVVVPWRGVDDGPVVLRPVPVAPARRVTAGDDDAAATPSVDSGQLHAIR